jgi:phage gp29-like protein
MTDTVVSDKEKKPGKEVFESLVESAKRDYSKFIATKKILENPSHVLKKTKEGSRLGLELFEEMEADDQIGSDLDIRRLKVSSFPFEIIVEGGTDQDAESAKELKKQINPIYRELVKEVQDALVYGYSITELFWEIFENRVELRKILGHQQGQV